MDAHLEDMLRSAPSTLKPLRGLLAGAHSVFPLRRLKGALCPAQLRPHAHRAGAAPFEEPRS